MMMMARSDDHLRVKEVHCRDVYVRGADVYTRLALIWRRRGKGKRMAPNQLLINHLRMWYQRRKWEKGEEEAGRRKKMRSFFSFLLCHSFSSHAMRGRRRTRQLVAVAVI
jgi:hypothetical protein